MKKIVFTLLLMTGMVQAQIITNFDPGFKNILVNYVTVDTNNDGIAETDYTGYMDTNRDGEIQVSEAQAVKSLVLGYFSGSPFMSYALQSVAGIENFTNVTYLDCHYNRLTSLDVSGMPQLQTLKCSENKLTSLNVSGLTNLKYLDFNYNELTSFDATGLNNLATLKCFNNQLTTLVVENLTKLEALDCHSNSLTALSLRGLRGVFKTLDCGFNSIASLDVTPFDLTSLHCAFNQISVLELPNQRNLQLFECYNNNLTTLDVSNCYALQRLHCNNNALTSLFIKNGISEISLGFSSNPNLAFICVDDAEKNAVQALATSYGLTNCAINSYCSFVPGGLYNNVLVFGGFSETGQCGTNGNLGILRVELSDGTNKSAAFGKELKGESVFNVGGGNFSLNPVFENPSYFNVSTTATTFTLTQPTSNGVDHTTGFCVSPNGSHQNVEGIVVPIIPAQPGKDAVYRIYMRNTGNVTIPSVSFVMMYDKNVVSLIGSSPITPLTPNGNFEYTKLLPFETRFVDITFKINSETDASPVQYNDELTFSLVYSPYGENTSNGNFTYKQLVKQQYALNEVLCLQGEQLPTSKIGDYLHYAFYFENTGTGDAKNVVIKEEIDATKFDVSSLQIVESSNSMYAQLKDNILEVIFQDINVKPKGGRGHILLKIKTKGSLKNGDSVSKKSNVYFDYLFPISSPEQTVTFADLGLTDSNKDISVAVYPNPVVNTVFVTSQHEIKKMELYDIQGRLLQTQNGDALQNQIDIQQQPNGVYLLKVTTTKGLYVDQLIKQ